jgi:hypothetical protein
LGEKRMKRYFAKPDTWFKEGTEAFYEEEMFLVGELFDEDGISHGSAIYRGTYVVGPNKDYDTYWHNQGYKEGDEVEMREHCCNSEFIVVEENKE